MKKYTKQEKTVLINKIKYWWHSIDLGDGVITPGLTNPKIHKIRLSAITKNLKGKTVLDIGAWDGYYSFECEKRGAKVTAIDNNQHKKHHNGFTTVRKILNSKVNFYQLDLYEIPKELKKKFDIILFFGVLYHIKYPLRALEILYDRTKKILILESHYIKTNIKEPIMMFYPTNELSNDSTNWWGPNINCLKSMLKVVGFKRVKIFKTYLNKKDRGRVIIKAYK